MRIIIAKSIGCVLVAAVMSGCPKIESDTSSSRGGGQPGIGAHVQRGKEKRSLQNDINQLAKLMQTYEVEFGRVPKTKEEFVTYIQRDAAHIVRAINDNEIVVLWGQPMRSGIVIAYEREPDLHGTHVVAYGDASTPTISTAQLQAALKSQGN
jgi:hypothetical protein